MFSYRYLNVHLVIPIVCFHVHDGNDRSEHFGFISILRNTSWYEDGTFCGRKSSLRVNTKLQSLNSLDRSGMNRNKTTRTRTVIEIL